jgi:regulator of sirC expression with transglutaminase-like and TPR domain
MSTVDGKLAAVAAYHGDAQRDELSAALLVAHLLAPDIDDTAVRRQLAVLSERLEAALPGGVTVAGLVDFLRDEGFQGAADAQNLDCSRIDRVLEQRRGIPITLSVPYLMLGRSAGLTASGINFPGHFLVAVGDVLIDPLHAQQLSREECLQRLADVNLQHLGSAAFAPATPDDMAVRMLNNVKAIHLARSDFVAALEIVDCQLPLADDHGVFQLERAEYWYRLGDVAAAIAVLEAARAQLQGTPWQAEVEMRLKRLAGRSPPTVH